MRGTAALSLLLGGAFSFLLQACAPSGTGQQEGPGTLVAGRGVTPLAGQWEFHWQQFVSPNETPRPKTFARVPSAWAGTLVDGKPVPPKGFTTYRLTVRDGGECPCRIHIPVVGSAYRLYANGRLVAHSGSPGSTPQTTEHLFRPQLSLPIPPAPVYALTWHVANFDDRSGGPWFAPRFGNSQLIESYRLNQIGLDLFLAGALLIMALYHVGLFLVRSRDRVPMYFAVFCLLMALRSVTEGEKYLFEFFPGIGWRHQVQISYGTFYLAVPVFARYFAGIFPNRAARGQLLTVSVAFGALLLLVLVTPVSFFTETLPIGHIGVAVATVFTAAIAFNATLRRQAGAPAFLAGVLVFGGAVLHDILLAYSVVDLFVLAPLGFFVFIFSQAFLLSVRFSRALQAEEDLARELVETNEAMRRFVPSEFLQILERPTLAAVRAGDQVQRRMTVLFSDIRAFTELSESMTPEQNFNFLNSYLKRMEPSIHRHGGFIDKFMGDGIMALFPGNPEQAIDSAIEMQRELAVFNQHRANSGYRALQVGIGIHVGDLILGMLGSSRRLEGTVISDAVNLASRLEDLTRTFGAQIIASEDTFLALSQPDRYRFRVLGRLRPRGRTTATTIFELLDGLDREARAYLLATKTIFERACHAMAAGDEAEALRLFRSALEENPEDRAAAYYVKLLGAGGTFIDGDGPAHSW